MAFESLLVFHFGLSVVMTLAGLAALLLRKGARPHRWAGNLFFGITAVLTASGLALIVLKPSSLIQGWIAMSAVYLAFTGWATARRRKPGAGAMTVAGAALGALIVVSAVPFALQTLAGPGGASGLTGIGLIAGFVLWFTILDLLVIRAGGRTGARRTARHLWRMGLALFIVAGSSTVARPGYYPEPIRPFLFAPMALVGAATLFFLVRTLLLRNGLALRRAAAT